MLALHPKMGWLSQFSMRDGSVKGRRRTWAANAYDYFLRKIFSHTWKKQTGLADTLFVPTPSESYVFFEQVFSSFGNGPISMASKEFLRNQILSEASRQKKKFFIIKQPKFHRYLTVFQELFPNLQVIHTVRDGRAVVASIFKKKHPNSARQSDCLTSFPNILDYWKEPIKNITKFKKNGGPLAVEIKYEEFCQDTHGHIRATLEKLSLEVDLFPFEKIPPFLPNTNIDSLSRLNPGCLSSIQAGLESELKQYGY